MVDMVVADIVMAAVLDMDMDMAVAALEQDVQHLF